MYSGAPKTCSIGFLLLTATSFFSSAALADAPALRYADNKELHDQLHSLAKANSKLIRVESLTRTTNKLDIWVVECGTGNSAARTNRPALLAVAGIEGIDLAGSAILVHWLETLALQYRTNSDVTRLLDSTTIYVMPRVNPEAASRLFSKVKTETAVNDRPVDDDHDGLFDEDGPEDLDGDDRITSMRIQDPAGEYILDPEDPRLLLKADRAKGEKGAWRFYSEGTDNDSDEAWNEDGTGGVNLNRNFPYQYRFFGSSAGLGPVSEPVARSLADFIVSHPNISVVFTFGGADNLVQTPKGEPPKRPPTALHEEDLGFYREMGKLWRDSLGLSKELTGSSEPGTFSDWCYFHRGRFSLAAKPWSPALQVELAKKSGTKAGDKSADKESTNKEREESKQDTKPEATNAKPDTEKTGKKDESDSRNKEERAFLKWADTNAPEVFVAWREFTHPDFKGKNMEIGGFAPLARSNPPEKFLGEFAGKEASFLTALAGKLPRIGIRSIEVKSLGESIYDLRVQLENTGYLPTALAQGAVSREVNPTRVLLDVPSAAVLSGAQRTFLGPIEGSGGMNEVRYIVDGSGRSEIGFEVISTLAGSVKTNIVLKETR